MSGWGRSGHRTSRIATCNHSSQLYHTREAEPLGPGPCLPHLRDPPHTPSQELSCVESSRAFAETSRSSLLKSRWDTHAGKESLSLFRLCKHLKSHFLFRSVGRMPPSLEASLKRDLDGIFFFFFGFFGGWSGAGCWLLAFCCVVFFPSLSLSLVLFG